METKLSQGQLREIHSAIKLGGDVPPAKSKGQRVKLIRSELAAIGSGDGLINKTMTLILTAPRMESALSAVRSCFLEATGSIPVRLEYTVSNGNLNPKDGTPMDHENLNAEAEPKTKKAKAPKEPKEPNAPKEPKVRGPKPERGALNGKLISTEQDANWRREGTFGHTTVRVIMENPRSTIEQIEKLGGRRKDIMWDLENNPNFIVLENDPDYVPKEPKAKKESAEAEGADEGAEDNTEE